MGREGPFPLILLPQFGGYWIEGTNHEISSIPETEPLQSPTTKVKLECNPTARIYRKHFLAKVSGWLGGRQGPGKGKWLGRHLGILSLPEHLWLHSLSPTDIAKGSRAWLSREETPPWLAP